MTATQTLSFVVLLLALAAAAPHASSQLSGPDVQIRSPVDQAFDDEVQIHPTVSFSGGVMSGIAENNRDCKATSMLCAMIKLLHKGPSLMISITPIHTPTAAYQLERV
ncbi:hypothetical protein FHG87_023293 [Trinorchestia longiramus]|nr:hypothetical protein FHG87_023293 [Trinorchestia longiramus]